MIFKLPKRFEKPRPKREGGNSGPTIPGFTKAFLDKMYKDIWSDRASCQMVLWEKNGKELFVNGKSITLPKNKKRIYSSRAVEIYMKNEHGRYELKVGAGLSPYGGSPLTVSFKDGIVVFEPFFDDRAFRGFFGLHRVTKEEYRKDFSMYYALDNPDTP